MSNTIGYFCSVMTRKGKIMDKTNSLIGKCGFYCGSCPTYVEGECTGCRTAHNKGDCYTFDCVDNKNIDYCGLCKDFPCNEIMTREKARDIMQLIT